MTDLVERLRAADMGWSGDAFCVSQEVAEEAAIEIERLTAALGDARAQETVPVSREWLKKASADLKSFDLPANNALGDYIFLFREMLADLSEKASTFLPAAGLALDRDQLIRTITSHSLCDLRHAELTADAILTLSRPAAGAGIAAPPAASAAAVRVSAEQMRKQIAQIIDPDSWKMEDGFMVEQVGACEALDKADAILNLQRVNAALTAPVAGDVAAEIIEQCAKVADSHAAGWTLTPQGLGRIDTAEQIASEIRALTSTKGGTVSRQDGKTATDGAS